MYYLSDRTIRNATSFPSLLSSVSPSGRSLSLQQMKDTNTREEGLRDKGGTKVRVFTAIAVISPRIEPCLSRSPPSRLMLIKSCDRVERDKR